MYTLIFKFRSKNGVVFDVYHTDGQGRQRIIGNIYCYMSSSTFIVDNYVKGSNGYEDLMNFHTLSESTEHEIPKDILEKLYDKAEKICHAIKSTL